MLCVVSPVTEHPAKTALQVHKLCQRSAERILNDFKPNLMIAIGGGGYVPARILRSASSTLIPSMSEG